MSHKLAGADGKIMLFTWCVEIVQRRPDLLRLVSGLKDQRNPDILQITWNLLNALRKVDMF